MVDGVILEMSPEEEASIRAEWAANEARPHPDPFDRQITPMLKALAKELAEALRLTEVEVLARLKISWENNGGI